MKKISLIIIALSALALSYYFWPQSETPIHLKFRSFQQLPGWKNADVRASLDTFKISCKAFLKHPPELFVGSAHIHVQAKDWQPICQAAMNTNTKDLKTSKDFFERWFKPAQFYQHKPVSGLFTGYYMPYLHGSLKKTQQYQIPLYGVPSDLISVNLKEFDSSLIHRNIFGQIANQRLVPYPARQEINAGKIKDKAKIIAWVDSPIERLFLEIQGSGVVGLDNGEELYVGYAAQNGRPYTAIGKVLYEKGAIPKDKLSMQTIRDYLLKHPEEIDEIINKNQSFVFFKTLSSKNAYGAQGVPLTPGFSLAIDRQYIPLGAPIWLSTTHPDKNHQNNITLQRLMIAQDTGGAIKGAVRGDVYWGAGDEATEIAGHMKNPGLYWVLLPAHLSKH